MIAEILEEIKSGSKTPEMRNFCDFFLDTLKNNKFSQFLQDEKSFNRAQAWSMILTKAMEAVNSQRPNAGTKTFSNNENAVKQSIIDIQDLRILRLCVQNLKCFPSSVPPVNEVYGVTATRDNQSGDPLSSVFLGGNGVGKSSLFLGLELAVLPQNVILRHIGIVNEKERKIALSHHGSIKPHIGEATTWQSLIDTCSGQLRSDRSMESPTLWPAFFYDDYDSHFLGLNNCSIEYLSEQLGLYEVLQLIILLGEIINMLNKANEIQRRGTTGNYILNQEQKDNADTTKRQEINKFNKKYPIIYSVVRDALPSLNLLKDLLRALRERHKQALQQLQDVANPIFKALFKAHLYSNNTVISKKDTDDNNQDSPNQEKQLNFNETIVTDFSQDPPKIVVRINDEKEIEPRYYFNTFRFKLYVVTLKISLACAAMRLRGVNFPIVLDDVFDSSDFQHRHDIQEFMYLLTNTYKRLKDSDKYPFQLILFTQDEIIADSAWRGLVNGLGRDNVKYSRLFHYNSAEESDKYQVTIDDKEYTFVNLESTIQ